MTHSIERREFLKVVPFIVSSWASAAYAQNRTDDEITQLFDIAAAKHRRELTDLWDGRGAPPVYLPNVSSDSITRLFSQDLRYIVYPEQTALLFYSYDEENLQSWLVNECGIQAYQKQNISKQHISEAIANLRHSLNVDSVQRSRVPRPRANAIEVVPIITPTRESREQTIANLTQILLPASISNKLETVKHLIIVPILEIGTVPYAILKPFDDSSFLIERMSISIAPSLFDLGQIISGVWPLSRSPLIVGNPYLPESEDWFVPPLPGAEQEAQAVANLMDTVPLLGRNATKTKIVNRATGASLLYFATHGVASSDRPLSEGFLMLSAPTFSEGWWTAREIQNTRLTAEIAVLSACQTGLGQTHDAGTIGLARAFQIAGVPRVVMSLWSVDDRATSELMQAFVRHLANHLPSEALRQAMLEIRQEYPEPSKWASFTVFGTER
ncbi:MAG: CHAT domain-containing protein [Cyanobacteriota bacterium]|nr:CHAT domain-containing protein [Cyanobacteriota bacterium]